jgi:molybdopterin/thiamine biosynthesis adenylyltransferase
LAAESAELESVADRQDRIPGFSTAILKTKKVLLIGAGGLGGGIATALARKGIGEIRICDSDLVEPSNLNRQVFYKQDLFKRKALRLARNAAREGCLGTVCVGHFVAFDETTGPVLSEGVDAVAVAVDNNSARCVAARLFREMKIPAVFTAVNEAANFGYVFVDDAQGPCIGCMFPRTAEAAGQRQPCQPTPAGIDILRTVAGMVTYAIDCLVMGRARGWNFRSVDLVGNGPDPVGKAMRRPDCALCGGRHDGGMES